MSEELSCVLSTWGLIPAVHWTLYCTNAASRCAGYGDQQARPPGQGLGSRRQKAVEFRLKDMEDLLLPGLGDPDEQGATPGQQQGLFSRISEAVNAARVLLSDAELRR